MLAVKTLRSDLNIFRRVVRLMGEQFEISVVGDNPVWAEARISNAVNEISRIEKLLSVFGDDSYINQINRNAGIAPVKVNAEIFGLISRAVQVAELTYGAFDIAYFSADADDDDTPVTTITNTSNYRNVVLDATKTTVFLKEKGMRISLAKNSKGYAADRAKYVLLTEGVSSGVINFGGDLLTWGTQPDHEPWTVAAADPEQERQPYAGLDISNMCFATSLNTEKYSASNVVNVKKGFPVSAIKSASVLTPSAELSDAMANPVISIGVNASLYLINKLNQIACLIIDDQNRVYTSKGINLAN